MAIVPEITTLERDYAAVFISNFWTSRDNSRQQWKQDAREVRNYIFAVTTEQTENKKLPWKNNTRIPKLTQIRDNLIANYAANLISGDWYTWEGSDEEAQEKRKAIMSYMRSKTRTPEFNKIIRRLLADYVDMGNAFGRVEYINETHIDSETGQETVIFRGPRPERISPYNIVFNANTAVFSDSARVIRYMKSIGELKKDMETKEHYGFDKSKYAKLIGDRKQINEGFAHGDWNANDFDISNGFMVDGFGSLKDYYESNMVEILEYEGDLLDLETGELHTNQLITIADRTTVLRQIAHPSWYGSRYSVHHVGWRLRPDNLWAQGPLDNLVGMQYRIDHLENIKADLFDLIAHPPLKIKGNVEEFEWGPLCEIHCGDDGDVEILKIDATALNADIQIERLEQQMERMAGAPEQAMGIRTPGEKTAFEVRTLDNASGRIYLEKINQFEEMLEQLLNQMLEVGRRNITAAELVEDIDEQFGSISFMTVTPEDLGATGKLKPVGAKHFAQQVQLYQGLVQMQQMLMNDPDAMAHVSGKETAVLAEKTLGLERYELVKDNIRLYERAESARVAKQLEAQLDTENRFTTAGPRDAPMVEGDFISG